MAVSVNRARSPGHTDILKSALAIGDFVRDLFSGNAQIDWRFGVQLISNPHAVHAGTGLIQVLAYSNITGCTAKSVEKLHCAMNNIAAAITQTFRDMKLTSPAYPASESKATGQAQTSAVHIGVHWQ
ncbi:unnamed protein product [Aspergillus oryzae]|nr:unnamed protein product [Aspergillus oryzae]